VPIPGVVVRDTSRVAQRRSILAVAAMAALVASCSGHPDRVHFLGRDYDRGNAGPMTLAAVREQSPSPVIVSDGKVIAGGSGLYAPTVIFVKDGASYYEFALSGGP
jgi:hypothetical protein